MRCAIVHTAAGRINPRDCMPVKARNLILTNSQAACLIALRHCKDSKSKIAIEAKLDLIKTATALGALARLGLAKQNPAKKWHATARGRTCRYETVPDHPRRNRALPGAGGRRVLALLHRPMRAREIAEKLGVTDQRVRQLVIKLHAQGYVSFGDPVNAFWIVMRAGDKTRLLSRGSPLDTIVVDRSAIAVSKLSKPPAP